MREHLRPSTVAWAVVPVAIYAYDKLAPNGEMMSQRADEWMNHPIKKKLFTAAVIALGLHLTNKVDPKLDLFAYILREKVENETK